MSASLWDQIGTELEALANASGGKHKLYKPVIRIEVYEHDDQVDVEVDRCKGNNGVVIQKGAMSGSWQEGLLRSLREARVEAETP